MMVLLGTAGNDVLRTHSLPGETVTVYGIGGADNIFGGHGTDIFVGGPGNDIIHARSNFKGGGKKVFLWNTEDGHDTIHYYNPDRKEGDGLAILKFGPGIGPENVETRADGNNVVFVITAGGSVGSIRVMNARAGIQWRMDEIHFADGTVLTWNKFLAIMVVRGTIGNDVLRTYSSPGETVIVYGIGGADNIYGGSGTDIFVGGPGNDIIHARSNFEGGGKKIFAWNVGDGHDTIYYYNPDRTEGDRLSILRFGPGIDPENVEPRADGSNVVFVITAEDGSVGSVRVMNARADIRWQMDAIRFADGTVWKWNTMPMK